MNRERALVCPPSGAALTRLAPVMACIAAFWLGSTNIACAQINADRVVGEFLNASGTGDAAFMALCRESPNGASAALRDYLNGHDAAAEWLPRARLRVRYCERPPRRS